MLPRRGCHYWGSTEVPQYGGVHGGAALAAAMVQRRAGQTGHRGGTHRVCEAIQFHAKSTPSNHFRQYVDLPPISKSKVNLTIIIIIVLLI